MVKLGQKTSIENIAGFDKAVSERGLLRGVNRVREEYGLRRIREVLLEFCEIKRDSLVLDAGCGTGELSKDAFEQSDRVVSADFSLESLKVAKRTLQNEGNTNFVLSDVTRSCFHDGCFDVILSSEVIEHIPRPSKMVTELANLLRVGGVLSITTPNPMFVFFHVSTIAWLVSRPRLANRKLQRRMNMWSHDWGCDLWIFPWHMDEMLRARGLTTQHSRFLIFISDSRGLLFRMLRRLMSQRSFCRFVRSLECFERSILGWAGCRYYRLATKWR